MKYVMWIVAFVFLFTTVVVSTWATSPVPPVYQVYETQEAFEDSAWMSCESATDGCNTYFMTDDGEVWAGTLKFCQDTPVEWSCTKVKEVLPVCTMEYAPVCGMDNMTYSNSCMAWNQEIAHEGMCEIDTLSENDRNLYNSLLGKVDKSYLTRVDKALNTYATRMHALRWSDEKMQEAHQATIDKTDMMITDLLMDYPQDIALPTEVNDLYLKLQLIKLELMMLEL